MSNDKPLSPKDAEERPEWVLRHEEAVKRGEDFYLDPETGYRVWTELYLKKRECCGSGCRHCPY